MKRVTAILTRKSAVFLLLVLYFLPDSLFSQARFRTTNVVLKITGTSTLHNWEETSSKGSANAVFMINKGKINDLSLLLFTMPVRSLKSEHKSMDNNTYKALRADKHPEVTYTLSSATVIPVNATTYSINTRGKLTIAGITRETDVNGTAKMNVDNSISVSGSKRLRMTDYNVTPPKVMMIRTGDDLTIFYNLKFTQ